MTSGNRATGGEEPQSSDCGSGASVSAGKQIGQPAKQQFISYAQNFEDVILWRALKHIDSGIYIDVGAHDPVVHSVSRAFYEHGWRGVHVEPMPAFAAALREARPDEVVVEAAISDRAGSLKFYIVDETGLSTGDVTTANAHTSAGRNVHPITSRTLPLSDILDQSPSRDVHWLKIDVEGMEARAIASWQPSTIRPWILVVEATEPNTPNPSHTAWEPTVEKLGYRFVYFDGLNRFYVHQDHAELASAFGPGPNVFDDFVIDTQSTPHFGVLLMQKLRNYKDEMERLHKLSLDLKRENIELTEGINSIRNSTSWRLTRVLRAIVTFIRSLRPH